jgi:hypothetical protein
MSKVTVRVGIAAVTLLTAATLAGPAAQAQNAATKAGNAIAYPFKKAAHNAGPSAKIAGKAVTKAGKDVQYGARKNASNLSVNAHRATGHNSVERRKNGAMRHDTVVTPKGDLKRLPK